MELKIYNPQEDGFLRSIDWNFQELKKEITAKADDYKNLVYDIDDDDQIKDAKKDRADLRKFNAALDDKRKEVKKRVMDPYTKFESQVKELTGIVDQAIDNIDVQVKDYEEIKRNEKLEKVRRIYEEEIGDLDRVVPFEKIFKEQWLNVSTTLKSIREEIASIYQKVDKDLKLINTDGSVYTFDMKEEYLKNFDLQAAIALKQRLEENERRKADFEAQRKREEEERQKRMKAEAQQIASAGKKAPQGSKTGKTVRKETPKKNAETVKRKKIVFEITANESHFDYLNHVLAEIQEELKNANAGILRIDKDSVEVFYVNKEDADKWQ